MMNERQVTTGLDALGLIQGVRTLRASGDETEIRAWMQLPRERVQVYAIALILAGIISDNTTEHDLDAMCLDLMADGLHD